MLRGIRPSTCEDAPEIVALLVESGLTPPFDRAEMQWKYWQRREDWQHPRSYVVSRGGDLLAHAALVPGALSWRGGRLRTLHMIDWAARPCALGAGIALMKHIGSLADALLAIGGSSDTLSILPRMGFRSVGRAVDFVRPLRPLRILRGIQGPSWKVLPRMARGTFWLATAPASRSTDGFARSIGVQDIPAVARDFPGPTDGMAIFERSEAMLRHTLACPITPIKLCAWGSKKNTRGYFLLAFAPGQARLVDFWTASEDPDDWRSLILTAVREAKRNGDAAELVAWASEARSAGALAAAGFHPRGVHPISLLADKSFRLGATTVRVQMLENDTAYRHRRRQELCA